MAGGRGEWVTHRWRRDSAHTGQVEPCWATQKPGDPGCPVQMLGGFLTDAAGGYAPRFPS